MIQAPEAFHIDSDWGQHAMSLHIKYLNAGLANWRQYLDYFAQRFKTLVSCDRAIIKIKSFRL